MIRLNAARAVALAILVAALAGLDSTVLAQPSGDRFQGFLSVVWGDPHPSTQGGTTRFAIVYPSGQRVPLDVPADLRNVLVPHSGKRVTLRGSASAESGVTRIRVQSIESAERARPQAEAVRGRRTVLFVLLKFKNDTQEPHTVNFFKRLTNPLTPFGNIPATINAFFDKVSYGRFKWRAEVAGNKWYTLPKTRAEYGNCGANDSCFQFALDELGDDALDLVAGDVDVNEFDNINFVFNNDLDCCAWGGTYANGLRSWGATWEPPWGQETSTYVHEMGHSLGLPHSGWRYHSYDSHHDEMSRGHPEDTVQCGQYRSVNFGGPNTPIWCNKPGAGYITAHQDFLGWIPNANKRTHSAVGVKNYVVEANSAPLGDKLKMVRVCLNGFPCSGAEGSNARFLTIEVKLQNDDFDGGVPSQGVVIHDVKMNRRNTVGGPCYFNSQSGWAMPFDARPNDFNTNTCLPQDVPGTGLLDMAYGLNQRFIGLGVRIDVVERAGKTFTVKVNKLN